MVATLRIHFKDAVSANTILRDGASIFNKRTSPKKPKKEPIRCLKCQKYGHEQRNCHAPSAICARCAHTHATDACPPDNFTPKCANCSGRHTSYNRDCPTFWDKCHLIDRRCPENNLAFYPTNEPWTWVTLEYDVQNTMPPPPPPGPRPPTQNQRQHSHHPQPRLTGSNNTPIGPEGRFPGSIPIADIPERRHAPRPPHV